MLDRSLCQIALRGIFQSERHAPFSHLYEIINSLSDQPPPRSSVYLYLITSALAPSRLIIVMLNHVTIQRCFATEFFATDLTLMEGSFMSYSHSQRRIIGSIVTTWLTLAMFAHV